MLMNYKEITKWLPWEGHAWCRTNWPLLMWLAGDLWVTPQSSFGHAQFSCQTNISQNKRPPISLRPSIHHSFFQKSHEEICEEITWLLDCLHPVHLLCRPVYGNSGLRSKLPMELTEWSNGLVCLWHHLPGLYFGVSWAVTILRVEVCHFTCDFLSWKPVCNCPAGDDCRFGIDHLGFDVGFGVGITRDGLDCVGGYGRTWILVCCVTAVVWGSQQLVD